MKRYDEKEMKRILKQELELPHGVNDKVYEAYGKLSGKTYQSAPVHSFRKWVLVGTAAAMFAVTSLGVLAANGFFTKQVTEQGEHLSYKFDMNYELTPYEIKVTPEYIPDGYTEFEEGKYDKDGQHKNGISICGINAAWLANDANALDVDSLKSLEKTTLNHMEAHVLTLNFDTERTQYAFDKRIYLFNPEDGYMVVVYGGNDISGDELKKVADHLKIEVDESHPMEYVDTDLKEKQDAEDAEWDARQKAAREKGADASQVVQKGEAFSLKYGEAVETTVVSARIVESLSDYEKEKFFDYDGDLAYWVNEDGSLKDYDRVSFAYGTMEEVSREKVGQKILEVKVRAKNLSDEIVDYWADGGKPCQMSRQEDGTYAYPEVDTEAVDMDHGLIQSERGAVYFDQPQHTGEDRNHFFYRDMQPDETLEYTLLYVIDEDMLDELYLNFNHTGEYENDLFVEMDVK